MLLRSSPLFAALCSAAPHCHFCHDRAQALALRVSGLCSVAALVTEHGLGDGKRWMANWEKAWQANFNSCNLEDQCVIQLS